MNLQEIKTRSRTRVIDFVVNHNGYILITTAASLEHQLAHGDKISIAEDLENRGNFYIKKHTGSLIIRRTGRTKRSSLIIASKAFSKAFIKPGERTAYFSLSEKPIKDGYHLIIRKD